MAISAILKDPSNITEDELRECNPWIEVAAKYVGNDFLYAPQNAQFVCKDDKHTIEAFNDMVRNKDYKYQLNCQAFPWLGNPLKARAILLTLNPGYAMREQTFGHILSYLPAGIVKEYACHLRDTLTFNSHGLFPRVTNNNQNVTARDLANFHGSFYWWDRIHSAFLKPESKTELDIENINENLAIIQLVGYSSRQFHPFYKGQKLQSQNYTRQLISYILKHNKETIFIVLRSVDDWKRLLDSNWTQNEDRFIICVNRAQSFGKKVLNNNFDKVVSLLAR